MYGEMISDRILSFTLDKLEYTPPLSTFRSFLPQRSFQNLRTLPLFHRYSLVLDNCYRTI